MIFGNRYEEFRNVVYLAKESETENEFIENLLNIANFINEVIENEQSFAKRLKRRIRSGKQNKNTSGETEEQDVGRTIVAFVLEKDGSKRNVFERNVENSELEIRVGRDPEWSDILIDSIFVSRRHAEIFVTKDGFRVRDMSLNGTYVESKRATIDDIYDIIPEGTHINVGRDREIELKIEKKPA